MVEATFRVHLLLQASQSANSGIALTADLNGVEEVPAGSAPSGLVDQASPRSSEVVIISLFLRKHLLSREEYDSLWKGPQMLPTGSSI